MTDNNKAQRRLTIINTWDGSVGVNSQWSGIALDDNLFEMAIKRYVANYYQGISILTGGGSLLEFWDDIEEFLIFEGHIAILEEGGYKFFARVFLEDYSLIGKENLTLINIDDAAKPKIEVIKNGEQDPRYKFVMFENNRMREPLLPGTIDYFIKKMVNIVRKMEIDLFTSERRVMLKVPQQPATADVDYQIQTFSNIFFTYIAMEHSRKPDAGQIKQGLTGIHPSQVGEPLYIEPKTDLTARFINQFNFWFSKMELFLGIRHDPLKDKDERAPVLEVSSSTSTFNAFEKKGWKSRIKGIREWQNVFKEPHANYKLKYGEYKGEQQQ